MPIASKDKLLLQIMSERIERQNNHIVRLEEKIIEAVHLLQSAAFFNEADEIYKILRKRYR